MTRTRKILLALDQFFGSILFKGIWPDETISAYCYRKNYWKRVAIIDWIMREENHCAIAYLNEKNRTQNAPEYRQMNRINQGA